MFFALRTYLTDPIVAYQTGLDRCWTDDMRSFQAEYQKVHGFDQFIVLISSEALKASPKAFKSHFSLL